MWFLLYRQLCGSGRLGGQVGQVGWPEIYPRCHAAHRATDPHRPHPTPPAQPYPLDRPLPPTAADPYTNPSCSNQVEFRFLGYSFELEFRFRFGCSSVSGSGSGFDGFTGLGSSSVRVQVRFGLGFRIRSGSGLGSGSGRV